MNANLDEILVGRRSHIEYLDLGNMIMRHQARLAEGSLDPLLEEMAVDCKNVEFELPVPASRQECLNALEDLPLEFGEISGYYRRRSEPIQKQLRHNGDGLYAIGRGLDDLAEKTWDRTKKDAILGSARLMHSSSTDGTRNLIQTFLEELEKQTHLLLQLKLRELVKDQDEELRNWFFHKVQEQAGSHLQITQSTSTRPGVFLDPPSSCLPETLPIEIMEMIFDLSSLEACVALREASKGWYAAFQNSERIMKRKMKQRNPWMKPGDPELQTWADCVLVFVGRLQSGKWEPYDRDPMPAIRRASRPVTGQVTRTVVGVELELDERLPANFSDMLDNPDSVSVYTSAGKFLWSPWTHTCRPERNPPLEDVSEDEDGNVVSYDGIEITLDLSTTSSDVRRVHETEKAIQLTLEDHTMWIFPKDRHHYRHALWIPVVHTRHYNHQGYLLEMGDAVFHHHRPVEIHTDRWSLVDFDKMGMTTVCEGFDIKPVALYNGLIWLNHEMHLFPTFVDRGKTYCRVDRTLCVKTERQRYKFKFAQGSRSNGLGQFVYTKRANIPVLVDLATGVVTVTQVPEGWSRGFDKVICGFQDGVFQVRCIKYSDLEEIKEKAKENLGLPDGEDDPYPGFTSDDE